MTRLCGSCGHPLGGGPFVRDLLNASRVHPDCTPEAEAARETEEDESTPHDRELYVYDQP